MKTLVLLAGPLLFSGLVASPAAAQGVPIDVSSIWEAVWRVPAPTGAAERVLAGLGEGPSAPAGDPFTLAPDALDYLAARLRTEAPPIERESLDGVSEAAVPFHDTPGGIVLGLVARAEGDWSGARLEVGPTGLALRARDGNRYSLPDVEPWLLSACLEFTRNPRGSDAVIDIEGAELDLAPELAGTPLAAVMERADRAPRRSIPGMHALKSLIVDRDVRFGVIPGTARILLRAEVEIRMYEAADSWLLRNALHRVATWPFADFGHGLEPLLPLPPGSDADALLPSVDEVATVAGWMGFLRWAAENDPGSVERLRAHLAGALQSGKVSASQR